MNKQIIDFDCSHLTLKLGDKLVFTDFNFKFSGPGIVMIEGDNGTGKSSLLKLFSGFLLSREGNVLLNGLNPSELKPLEFSFFTTTSLGLLDDLTGQEHIDLIAKSLAVDKATVDIKIKDYCQLEIFSEILQKRVSDYSQGMKQLLRLFIHLFFEPKVLYLDEPFLYLSPKLKEFVQIRVENLSLRSLVFITDQKFTWAPSSNTDKIQLGGK